MPEAHNNKAIEALGSEVFTIQAKDSVKDEATKRCDIEVDKSQNIRFTGNLPGVVKVCEGARIIIKTNLDVEDNLVNGSIGIIKYLSGRGNLLNGKIYVKFDDPLAGNQRKSNK